MCVFVCVCVCARALHRPSGEDRRRVQMFFFPQSSFLARQQRGQVSTAVPHRRKPRPQQQQQQRQHQQRLTFVLISAAAPLWSKITNNPDVSTGPLALPFASLLAPLSRSLTPPFLLRLRALLRFFACTLTHLLVGK